MIDEKIHLSVAPWQDINKSLAGVELDETTRKCTGRMFIQQIANRKRSTFGKVINRFVLPGVSNLDRFSSFV